MPYLACMAERKIRVGIIGVGRGRSFADDASERVGMELVALCDRWEEKLDEAGAEFGVATYTDYEKFLEHDMDAVFALADVITVMVYGKAIASGPPKEIRSNPQVVKAYLGEEAASAGFAAG